MNSNPLLRWVGVLMLSAVTLTTWAASNSPISYSGQLFFTSDDNIGKSQWGPDIKSDMFATLAGSASYTKGYGAKQALTFSASAELQDYFDFNNMSNTQVGVTVDYRFMFNRGFTAPLFSLFYRVKNMDFESDIRDSVSSEMGLTMTRRMTDKITTSLGVASTDRRADGVAFDLEKTRYFFNLDWVLSKRFSGYLTVSRIDGDVASSASQFNISGGNIVLNPLIQRTINLSSPNIEVDDAFGDDASTFAYRLDADTLVSRLGGNYALSHRSSLDLSIDLIDSEVADAVFVTNPGGGLQQIHPEIYYEVQQITLAYLRRF